MAEAQARHEAADKDDAHLVPGPGKGVTEGVDRAVRVGSEGGGGGKEHAGCPQGKERRAWADGTEPHRARRIVSGPAREDRRDIHAPARGEVAPQSTGGGDPSTRRGIGHGRGWSRREPCRTSRAGRRRATACRTHPTSPRPLRRSRPGAHKPWEGGRGAVRSKIAGSCLRTQASFGAVKPGIALLPQTLRSCGQAASSSRHSATARPSFHRMQGRRGRWSCPRSVAPCIWPESPIPRTLATAPGWREASTSMVARVAATQLSGSCSEWPGWGRSTVRAMLWASRRRCAASTRTVLTPDVPISMPRYTMPPSSQAPRDRTRLSRTAP